MLTYYQESNITISQPNYDLSGGFWVCRTARSTWSFAPTPRPHGKRRWEWPVALPWASGQCLSVSRWFAIFSEKERPHCGLAGDRDVCDRKNAAIALAIFGALRSQIVSEPGTPNKLHFKIPPPKRYHFLVRKYFKSILTMAHSAMLDQNPNENKQEWPTWSCWFVNNEMQN